jgi:hypothetical protein
LLDDLLVAEDARAEEGMVGDVVEPLSSMADLSTPSWKARTATRNARARLPTLALRDSVASACMTRACAPRHRHGWRMWRHADQPLLQFPRRLRS